MVMEHNDSLVYFGCRLAFLDGFNFLPSRSSSNSLVPLDLHNRYLKAGYC
ncbi:hypothetical protein ZOSMA_128G00390 [Zostera marina]|uniref:Uncharacterized protein n=1 Tax=Zostera marina TaxID=29655 RepID=A0A0K9PZX4_ZOSMR|nr:hypothetical protein ZOSMA_128G00390 [Zostera marina]